MKRYIPGLSKTNPEPGQGTLNGVFLVRVECTQHRWHTHKPYFFLVFLVLEPSEARGRRFTARLYATTKALWKLNWFLRDFGYDAERLGRDEIDDKKLVGLCGVVKISHSVANDSSLLNLDAFAPQERWPELATETAKPDSPAQVAS